MRIGICGTGRLGSSLTIALKKEGFNLTGVYNRTKENSRFLDEQYGIALFDKLESLIKESDVVFITVKDSVIISICQQIISMNRIDIRDKAFIHCSGVLSSDIFKPLVEKGARSASIHPIQSFPNTNKSWESLYNISFGVEGDDEVINLINPIIKAFSGNILRINSAAKALYHAAACVTSNYSITLMAIANTILGKCGIPSEDGIVAFTTLMEASVKNLKNLTPSEALTGPIARGDVSTIKNHLKALTIDCSELLPVYKALGDLTTELAREKGNLEPGAYDSLKNLFK